MQYPVSTGQAGAGGYVRGHVSTYRILERNRKFDYFILDTTMQVVKTYGDPDYGWVDVKIENAGRVRTIRASGNKGITDAQVDEDGCHKYPLNLGIAIGPISAGTTVGSFGTCNASASIDRHRVKRGAKYRVNRVTGARQAVLQRLVKVRKNHHPRFTVDVRVNLDSTNCISGGSGSGAISCAAVHNFDRRHMSVGTKR